MKALQSLLYRDAAAWLALQVLEIVAAALQAMGNSHPDAARGFLDVAVQARPSVYVAIAYAYQSFPRV